VSIAPLRASCRVLRRPERHVDRFGGDHIEPQPKLRPHQHQIEAAQCLQQVALLAGAGAFRQGLIDPQGDLRRDSIVHIVDATGIHRCWLR
jgi:hypothetical protein